MRQLSRATTNVGGYLDHELHGLVRAGPAVMKDLLGRVIGKPAPCTVQILAGQPCGTSIYDALESTTRSL